MPHPKRRVVARAIISRYSSWQRARCAYSSLHTLTAGKLHCAHNVLLHLDELSKLLGQVGAESTSSRTTESVACAIVLLALRCSMRSLCNLTGHESTYRSCSCRRDGCLPWWRTEVVAGAPTAMLRIMLARLSFMRRIHYPEIVPVGALACLIEYVRCMLVVL